MTTNLTNETKTNPKHTTWQFLVHLRWLCAKSTRVSASFFMRQTALSDNYFLNFLLLSPCGYVHHDSITVSETIPREGSMVTCIYTPIFPLTPWIFSQYYELWMGKVLNYFAILRWETLSLNWLTTLSQSLAQSGEPRPILACKV